MRRIRLFFVRHGQRIDHVDSSWALSSPVPQDPPLTTLGLEQSQRTGVTLATLLNDSRTSSLQERDDEMLSLRECGRMTPPESPEAEQGQPLPFPRPQHVAIITSPFLRCTQTAVELAKGLRSHSKDYQITMAVEPGIAEWLSFEYVPEPVSDSIIVQRMQDFAMTRREHEQFYVIDWKYRAQTISLPSWPEAREAMQSRIEETYSHIVKTYLESPMFAGKDISIVFVSHASPVNALLEACLQTPTLVPIGLGSITQCNWISEQDYQAQEQARHPLVALASPPHGLTLSSTAAANQSFSRAAAPKTSPALSLAGMNGRWRLDLQGSVAHLS